MIFPITSSPTPTTTDAAGGPQERMGFAIYVETLRKYIHRRNTGITYWMVLELSGSTTSPSERTVEMSMKIFSPRLEQGSAGAGSTQARECDQSRV